MRVLVVEDDPDVAKVVTLALEGHDVTVATDGRKALDLLRHATFDAVVLDLMLPEVDGLSVLSHIRAEPTTADLPVVVLTARVRESDHVRGYERGADRYLTKPFDPTVLAATVEEVVRTPLEQRVRQRAEERERAEFLRRLEGRF